MEQTRPGLSVTDLLRIPQFKDAVLLGGASGLSEEVSRVNVMEVPDVVDWVRPGEFLMTTGYPFRQEPEVMVTLIEQLAEKGVAALGIKTKRYIDAVPESAIRAADACGLPLIELPPDTTFSDVVREVMERVLVQESKQLALLQYRVQRLSYVLLHGDGLDAFLQLLESLVDNPVALLDDRGQWTASQSALRICERLEAEDWRRLREESPRETSFLPAGDRSIRVYGSADQGGERRHMLLLFEERQEFSIVDSLTINWASELVGFEISTAQARRKIEAKYIDQFLQDWIVGRIVSPIDLQLRAEACGCPLDAGMDYRVGIIAVQERKLNAPALQEIAQRLNWERTGGEMRWTVIEENLVVVIASPKDAAGSGSASDRRKDDAGACAAAALRPYLSGRERDYRVCLGRAVAARESVPISYREARRAAEVSAVCRLQQEVVSYADLGTYLLLYRLLGTEEAEEFKLNYLQALLEYDNRSSQGTLLKTLKTYFECNGNVKETADRMFLHYNTVIYRLDRIKNELGIPLDLAETRLQLQLAIKLHEIKEA